MYPVGHTLDPGDNTIITLVDRDSLILEVLEAFLHRLFRAEELASLAELLIVRSDSVEDLLALVFDSTLMHLLIGHSLLHWLGVFD